MLAFLNIAAIAFAIITFSTSFAHALELPGKMRLDRDDYCRVQPIYYPGFTIAGIAEPLTIVACLALVLFGAAEPSTPTAIELALGSSVLAHATYWLMTHRVNGFWLQDQDMGRAGRAFFGLGPRAEVPAAQDAWQSLRRRWEWSHVLRALFATGTIAALLYAWGNSGP